MTPVAKRAEPVHTEDRANEEKSKATKSTMKTDKSSCARLWIDINELI